MLLRPSSGFQTRRVPEERLPQIELMPVLARRNAMHGLLEVDVSRARRRLREHGAETGERLSFTAFLIACLARAVAEAPTVQAFRRGRRLIVFDDVDIATLVEVGDDGAKAPVPYVVRDAARKTVSDIHGEIRAAQASRQLVPSVRRRVRALRWLPRPFRLLLWYALARSPVLRKHFGGTVVVTSVGMFGAGPGWGLGVVSYPVTLVVGGIATRPVLSDGVVENREHLCLTVSLDHEVTDGAPAARFVARLRQLIEEPCLT
jgi:pyruvate/2-oxoglutarate dehydrogenase complex dihydrolipoamide acyltransferase (E2) component